MPIDRPSGGHDEPDEGQRAADRPAETPVDDQGHAKPSYGSNLANLSVEDLLSADRPHTSKSEEQTSEPRLAEDTPPKRHWLDIDSASDEELISFLGLDRTDRVPASEAGNPPARQSTDRDTTSPDESREGVRLSAEQLDEARSWLADNHPSPADHPGQGLKTWGPWWDD